MNKDIVNIIRTDNVIHSLFKDAKEDDGIKLIYRMMIENYNLPKKLPDKDNVIDTVKKIFEENKVVAYGSTYIVQEEHKHAIYRNGGLGIDIISGLITNATTEMFKMNMYTQDGDINMLIKLIKAVMKLLVDGCFMLQERHDDIGKRYYSDN